MPGEVGAQRGAVAAAPRRTTTHQQRDRGAEPGRAAVPIAEPAMPEPEAVDQGDVEHDVGQVAGDRDHQRRAGVLQAAQHAGGGQHQQQRHGTPSSAIRR